MRIALLKDIASPYRIPLFNELAGRPGIDFRLLLASRNDPRRDYPFHADEFRFEARVLPGLELRRGLRWVVWNRGLRRELSRFRPDALIVGGWAQPVFWQAMLWARRRGVPLVLWVESTERDARSGAAPLEAAKRVAVRSASGFLVPGRAAAAYMESFGVDPELIEIAPNAVDLSLFRDRVEEARVRRAELRSARDLDGCVFVCVSRLSHEKGVDVLVRAFADVPGLLVAIGDGPQEAELRATAPPNVRLVGRVERDALPEWYAAADAFVMPSRSETWGMAMSEAAAAGLPIVSTDAPGAAHELVDEGANGFRVPVGDEQALRAVLARVAGDAGWREAARRRTLELARAFTPAAWADAVERLVVRLRSPSV
jgi:glycosyltransferase involved in cell wall biosynthesis